MKVVWGLKEALRDVAGAMILLSGDFGLCGIPKNCAKEIVEKGLKNLTVISNNAGVDNFGIGKTSSKENNYLLC